MAEAPTVEVPKDTPQTPNIQEEEREEVQETPRGECNNNQNNDSNKKELRRSGRTTKPTSFYQANGGKQVVAEANNSEQKRKVEETDHKILNTSLQETLKFFDMLPDPPAKTGTRMNSTSVDSPPSVLNISGSPVLEQSVQSIRNRLSNTQFSISRMEQIVDEANKSETSEEQVPKLIDAFFLSLVGFRMVLASVNQGTQRIEVLEKIHQEGTWQEFIEGYRKEVEQLNIRIEDAYSVAESVQQSNLQLQNRIIPLESQEETLKYKKQLLDVQNDVKQLKKELEKQQKESKAKKNSLNMDELQNAFEKLLLGVRPLNTAQKAVKTFTDRYYGEAQFKKVLIKFLEKENLTKDVETVFKDLVHEEVEEWSNSCRFETEGIRREEAQKLLIENLQTSINNSMQRGFGQIAGDMGTLQSDLDSVRWKQLVLYERNMPKELAREHLTNVFAEESSKTCRSFQAVALHYYRTYHPEMTEVEQQRAVENLLDTQEDYSRRRSMTQLLRGDPSQAILTYGVEDEGTEEIVETKQYFNLQKVLEDDQISMSSASDVSFSCDAASESSGDIGFHPLPQENVTTFNPLQNQSQDHFASWYEHQKKQSLQRRNAINEKEAAALLARIPRVDSRMPVNFQQSPSERKTTCPLDEKTSRFSMGDLEFSRDPFQQSEAMANLNRRRESAAQTQDAASHFNENQTVQGENVSSYRNQSTNNLPSMTTSMNTRQKIPENRADSADFPPVYKSIPSNRFSFGRTPVTESRAEGEQAFQYDYRYPFGEKGGYKRLSNTGRRDGRVDDVTHLYQKNQAVVFNPFDSSNQRIADYGASGEAPSQQRDQQNFSQPDTAGAASSQQSQLQQSSQLPAQQSRDQQVQQQPVQTQTLNLPPQTVSQQPPAQTLPPNNGTPAQQVTQPVVPQSRQQVDAKGNSQAQDLVTLAQLGRAIREARDETFADVMRTLDSQDLQRRHGREDQNQTVSGNPVPDGSGPNTTMNLQGAPSANGNAGGMNADGAGVPTQTPGNQQPAQTAPTGPRGGGILHVNTTPPPQDQNNSDYSLVDEWNYHQAFYDQYGFYHPNAPQHFADQTDNLYESNHYRGHPRGSQVTPNPNRQVMVYQAGQHPQVQQQAVAFQQGQPQAPQQQQMMAYPNGPPPPGQQQAMTRYNPQVAANQQQQFQNPARGGGPMGPGRVKPLETPNLRFIEYDGKTFWPNYTRSLERQFIDTGTPTYQWITLTLGCLKGVALDKANRLLKHCPRIDWNGFCREMTLKLHNDHVVERRRLRSMHKLPNETYAQLQDRLQDSYQLAYAELADVFPEGYNTMEKDAFQKMACENPWVDFALQLKEPQTMGEAAALADGIAQMQHKLPATPPTKKTFNSMSAANSPAILETDVAAAKALLIEANALEGASLMYANQKDGRANDKSPKRNPLTSMCYNCGDIGHFAKDCPKPKKAPPI